MGGLVEIEQKQLESHSTLQLGVVIQDGLRVMEKQPLPESRRHAMLLPQALLQSLHVAELLDGPTSSPDIWRTRSIVQKSSSGNLTAIVAWLALQEHESRINQFAALAVSRLRV